MPTPSRFLFALVCLCLAPASQARDFIRIVGSSTVYPFATVVAEEFSRASGLAAPIIESTGSGGGLKLFCAGLGTDTPDIANASRRIKASELEQCHANGVTEVVEVLIGYDGIAVARSVETPAPALTREQLYLALAKQVPGADGTLVANPYTHWQQISPQLPDAPIEVLGPPPTSGTRDAFVELVMEHGALQQAGLAALRKADDADLAERAAALGVAPSASGKRMFETLAHTLREDGAYVETGENDNLIVQKLGSRPTAFGIFGFSFLDQNGDRVHGASIDGHAPTFEAIADGDYPISRPLYFYLKKAHVGSIPGLHDFARSFLDEDTIGEDGYLLDRGLIPLPEAEQRRVSGAVAELKVLRLP